MNIFTRTKNPIKPQLYYHFTKGWYYGRNENMIGLFITLATVISGQNIKAGKEFLIFLKDADTASQTIPSPHSPLLFAIIPPFKSFSSSPRSSAAREPHAPSQNRRQLRFHVHLAVAPHSTSRCYAC